jgi:hypothetical protein
MTALEDHFELNPKARRALQWEIAQPEQGERQGRGNVPKLRLVGEARETPRPNRLVKSSLMCDAPHGSACSLVSEGGSCSLDDRYWISSFLYP